MDLIAGLFGPYRLSVYLLPHAVAAAVSLVLAGYVARRSRDDLSNRIELWIIVLLVGAAGWSLSSVFTLASVSRESLRAWTLLGYGFTFLPPIAWVVVAAEYADRGEWITRRTLALLAVEPAVVSLLLVTNDAHHLLWSGTTLVDLGPVVVAERTFGPALWFHVVYTYALLLLGAFLFFRALRAAEGAYRGQVAALFGMVVAPAAGNLLYFTDVPVVSQLDFTAAGFTVTALLLVTAILRYRFLDLTPIGYSTAIRNVDDLYVVLDREHQLVELNPAARSFFGLDPVPTGRPADDVLPFEATALTADAAGGTARHDLDVERSDGPRHFDVRVTPIGDDELLGWSLVFRDVTERRERARDLERKNERLETFASIVSHDLRNPLNVAQGHLQLIETDDAESRERVADALDRMDDIIDDTLVLLREGQEIGEQEPTDLAAAARTAWSTVETGDATLAVEGGLTFGADPSRLQHLFENLFRNAVEHATPEPPAVGEAGGPQAAPPLGIRVGPLADGEGFYVEDDGPGIPPESRDQVFELGYSTNRGGTGFGLGIVKQVATAHGWEIHVAEGSDGGARFEVDGVTVLG